MPLADARPPSFDGAVAPSDCAGAPAGGPCEGDGECDPAGNCLHVLAETTTPAELALDDSFVYWTGGGYTAEGYVARCGLLGCGGAPTTLAPGRIAPGPIAVDRAAGTVFWADSNLDGFGEGQILAVATTPPFAPRSLFLGPYATSIAIDETFVYLGGMGELRTCARTGCAATSRITAHTGYSFQVLLVASTLVWVSSEGGIHACEPSACAPRVVWSGTDVSDLATDGTDLYWTEWSTGSVRRCGLSDCRAPATLASGLHGAAALATDGVEVYVGTTPMGAGAVYAMPAAPSPTSGVRVVGSGPRVFSPGSVAIDARSAYWTDFNTNLVVRVAR